MKKMMATAMCKKEFRIGRDNEIKKNEIMVPEEQARCQKKRDRFNGMGDKLKKSDFKDKMLKESSVHFVNEKFEDEVLDANTNLIGFLNGVYDLSTMEFREGQAVEKK